MKKLITSNHIVEFGVRHRIFTEEVIKKLHINYKDYDAIDFIKILKKRDIVRTEEIEKLMKLIVKGEAPFLEKDISETAHSSDYLLYLPKTDNTAIPFKVSKELGDEIKPIFIESKQEPFSFHHSHMVIHSFNHSKKIIYILGLAPTEKTINKIKKFKEESKELREVKAITYMSADGEEYQDERSFEDYNIFFISAPYSLITTLYEYNKDVRESIREVTENISANNEKHGIVQTDIDQGIYVIDKGLDEDNQTIDALVYRVLNEQFKNPSVSDIHIEPLLDSVDPNEKNAGFIRYRIDGDLRGRETELVRTKDGKEEVKLVPTIPNKYRELISRLKEKSEIPNSGGAELLPGDGKLKILIKDREDTLLEYRVSTIPEGVAGKGGMDKMVLRKLERGTEKLDLRKMRMNPEKIELLEEYIGTMDKHGKFKDGIILMTGPTGSGKSTTLFSILNSINKGTINIQTLEDPIEYVIPGINQSQILDSSTNDPDATTYTYAKGIKACLRQDPDVILIGEIRDAITMDIAKDAASTGHLVFSSLHTNDTWQTLDRLEGLEFDMKLVGNIIRLIMAQRLGKTICPYCIREYNDKFFSGGKIEKEVEIEQEYLEMKMDIVRKLLDSPLIDLLPNKVEDIILYRGKGCIKCGKSGTKGRAGIYEFLPITVPVSKFVNKYGTAIDNETVRKELLVPNEIITLHQDALMKTFKPIVGQDGSKSFISYYDALSAAGADPYEWDRDYLDSNLEELNFLLKTKKLKKQYDKNQKKLSILKTNISAEKGRVNAVNKERKQKVIQDLINQYNEIVKEQNKIKETLKKLEG